MRKAVLFVDILLIVLGVVGVYHVKEKAWHPLGNIRITSVNGIKVGSSHEAEFLFDGLQIGESVLIGYTAGSKEEFALTNAVPFYTIRYLIIQSVVGFICLAVGLFVFLKRPHDKAALLFHWSIFCTGLIILTTWGRYTIEPYGLGHLIRVAHTLIYAFVGPLFLHFIFVFPREKWHKADKLLYPLYGFALLITIISAIPFFPTSNPISLQNYRIFRLLFDICRIFFVICAVSSIVNFIHSYRVTQEGADRRKLRWILLGLLVGPLSFIILWVIPQVFAATSFVSEEIIHLLIAIIPITFAIAIVKYQIMNINLIISRATVNTIIFFLLNSIFAKLIGVFYNFVGGVSFSTSIIILSFTSIVIVIMYEPIKTRVQLFVDKRFFRVQYIFREVQKKYIEKVYSCYDLETLATFTVEQIDNVIPTERIGFVAFGDNGNKADVLAGRGLEPSIEYSVFSSIVSQSNLKSAQPVVFQGKVESEAKCIIADYEFFLIWKLAMIVPIASDGNKVLGLLVLGDKKSKLRYSIDDIDLITHLAMQSGVAMQRISLQKKLMLEKAESKRLEELNQLKSFFTSSVSHELKTPLTSIILFLEILEMKRIAPEKELEYIRIIKGESHRLSRLIENVLDFSKIEKGTRTYHFERISLNEILHKVLAAIQPQLSFQKFNLLTSFQSEEIIINADKDAVAQAATNLLSNAIKYSKKTKEIEVSLSRKNNFAEIMVKDKGIGIPKEELQNIFEPFFRATNLEAQRIGGTGIGLTLVKHIMDAHNGKIEIESDVGVGTCCKLLFPIVDYGQPSNGHLV